MTYHYFFTSFSLTIPSSLTLVLLSIISIKKIWSNESEEGEGELEGRGRRERNRGSFHFLLPAEWTVNRGGRVSGEEGKGKNREERV